MGRKTITVTITDPKSRDKGKSFLITEMPAMKAEKWANRALLVVGRSGVDVGEAMGMGMAGIVLVGLQAVLRADFDAAEPLLDEMMTCVQVAEEKITRALHEDDIEEVSTLWRLRDETLELHTGFSMAAALSKLGEAAKSLSDTNLSEPPTSPPA